MTNRALCCDDAPESSSEDDIEKAAQLLAETVVRARLCQQMRKEADLSGSLSGAMSSAGDWLSQNPTAAAALAGAGAGGLYGGATSLLGRRNRKKNFLGNTLTGALAGGAVGGGGAMALNALGIPLGGLADQGKQLAQGAASGVKQMFGGEGSQGAISAGSSAKGPDAVEVAQKLTELQSPGPATMLTRGIASTPPWLATLGAVGAADVGLMGVGALSRNAGRSPISGKGLRAAIDSLGSDTAKRDSYRALLGLNNEQLGDVARHARSGNLSPLIGDPNKLSPQLMKALEGVSPQSLRRRYIGTYYDPEQFRDVLRKLLGQPTGANKPLANAASALLTAGDDELQHIINSVKKLKPDFSHLAPPSKYGPEVSKALADVGSDGLRGVASSRLPHAWGGMGHVEDVATRLKQLIGGAGSSVEEGATQLKRLIGQAGSKLLPHGESMAPTQVTGLFDRWKDVQTSPASTTGLLNRWKNTEFNPMAGTGYVGTSTGEIAPSTTRTGKLMRYLAERDRGALGMSKLKGGGGLLRAGGYVGLPLAAMLYGSHSADQTKQQQAAKLLQQWQQAQGGA